MPRKEAVRIKLSGRQENVLRQIMSGTHNETHFKMRAEIVFLANSGESNNGIERKLAISGETVTKWRDKYASCYEEIARIETETPRKLRKAIEKVLSDAPRSGAPSTFTDEQVACILALACEEPSKLGLPFSHWTPTLLQIETLKRGVVDSISAVHIGRFLKRKRFKTSLSQGVAEP